MKNFLLILLIPLFSSKVFAGDYKTAMADFMNNDRMNAIEGFEAAVSSGDHIAESHLMLSFIHSTMMESEKSFKHFNLFTKSVDNPYPYIITLISTGQVDFGGRRKTDEQLEFINALVDDPRTPGKLRAKLYDVLGEDRLSYGDFKEAKEYFSKIGSIDAWSSVGPFENISAGGFNKDFGAVDNPQASHNFKSRYGANIKWFEIYGPRLDKWVDNEYFFSTGNAIVYSQTFIKSPSKQKVQLRFGVSGSLKVWLNDHLIFEEKEERNNDHDSYILETNLEKGNNRILIQVGESEANASNYMLRITDENGNAIEGLTALPFGSNYSDVKPSVKYIEAFEEVYLEEQVKKDPSIFNNLIMSFAYLRNDKKYLARKALTNAIDLAPKSSFLKTNLASIYIREGNRTGLALLIEWFKDNDLTNPLSLGLVFNEAIENEDYDQADSLLGVYEGLFGRTPSYYSDVIEVASAKDETEKLIETIEVAFDKYPTVPEFLNLKCVIESKVNNNTARAIKLRKKYLKKIYDTDMARKLAGDYFSTSSYEKGFEIYKQEAEDFPYFVGTLFTLSDFYTQIRDYRTALNYVEKCIDIAPYQDDYWGKKGEIHEQMEEYAEAEEAYERAIELYPNNYNVREKLRLLNDKESIFSLFEEEDYYEVFENAPDKEEYPDDNSVILRYNTQKVVYEGGGSEEKVVMLVKVFNSAGIDDWKEYYIPIYNFQNGVVEKVEVIKKDGSKMEAERSGTTVVFTNLEPGDGILVIYRVKNYYFGQLSFNMWEQHPFTLSYPYVNNSYSLLISPNKKFNYEFSNGGFEPEVSKKGEFDLYVWSKNNAEAIKSENYMSRYVDFGENLFISTFNSWSDISHWYSDLAATKSKPDFEVKEQVAALFEGKEDLSDMEKVKTIYNFIVKNIRYSSVSFRQSGLIPQKASNVLNTKIGDCKDVSTLFVSMCKEAGIEDVGLVLVNTRDNGRKDLTLPSISFNHCIARVNIDNVTYYVELTSENNSFLTYGDNLINSYALEIYDQDENKEAEAFYFNPSNRVENSVYRKTKVTISGSDLDLETVNTKTGNWASYMRYRYKDLSEEEQRKEMHEALNSNYKNTKLDVLAFPEFDTLTNDFTYSYSFKVNNAVTKIAGLNIFKMPWSDGYETSSLISDTERKYPVELWRYLNFDTKKETISFSLPAGTRFAERPNNVTIDNEFATYSIKYTIKGNTIEATRTLTPKVNVVEAKDFDKLKSFIDQMIENDTQNIAFK